MSDYTGAVLKELDRAFNQGTISGLTEGSLLERFVSGRDEAAFGALVARHRPMVLGVCRRLRREESDVDDAFQATFLVLARRAGAIRRGDLVGHWLYGVAHRVAVRARAIAARRRVREPAGMQTALMLADTDPHSDENFELRAILDQELARLPATLRSPVVLCYLEGLTHDEAAHRLRWPVGTVRSRMARARELLRGRLARRGFMADQATMATALAQQAVPLEWIDRAVNSSSAFATKQAAATGLATKTAIFLAKGVLHAMTISKIKTLGMAILVAGLTFGGVQTLACQYGGLGQKPKPRAAESAGADDRREAMLRTVDRVDGLLDELAKRNADVQRELRLLRKEIDDLRSTGSKNPDPISSQVGLGPVERTVTDKPADAGKPDTLENRSFVHARKPSDELTGAGPSVVEFGAWMMVASPRGDRVAVYNRTTGKTSAIRFPVPPGARYTITPNQVQPGFLAPTMQGPQITRIAVYLVSGEKTEKWYSQALREPVEVASPIAGNFCVAYVLGRRVYAFSALRKSWDVLELDLPWNVPALSQSDDLQSFKVVSGSHIYTFDQEVGKWVALDLDAILDGKQPVEKSDVRPRSNEIVE